MSRRLTIAEIGVILQNYGFSVTPEYCAKVGTYTELLLHWNRKVSLTSLGEPIDIVKFHFGESLFGIRVAKIADGRLADFGSGAGFPGIPISMAVPDLDVTLIESNGKKAAFLKELRRALSLGNVDVYRGRAEDLTVDEKFDFVTARAVGAHPVILKWAKARLQVKGCAVLWLNGVGVRTVRRVEGWKWFEPQLIPATKDRFVEAGTPRD